MINLSRVITDPRFSQTFKVIRKESDFVNGRFTQKQEKELNFKGVIKPASPKVIEMIPEGDRVGGEISISTLKELFITGNQGTSDEVFWNNTRYKVYSVSPYKDFGFYRAIAIRKEV